MKKNKLLDIITKDQLIKDFKELKSSNKIAKKYKLNASTVNSAFSILGLKYKTNKDITKILTKEILIKKYEELKTIKAVARFFKIDASSVKKYIIKFNINYKKQVKYNVNHNFFKNETEESFYWAGFIAADGCVKNRKNRFDLSVSLSKKDKDHVIKLKNILEYTGPVRDFVVRGKGKYKNSYKSEIAITSKEIFNDLAKFNIVPRKTLIYTFPEWLKNHPLKHHFMRGYNDGDGCFYISKLKEGRTVKQLYFSAAGTQSFLTDYRSILENDCDLKKRNYPIKLRKNTKIAVLQYGGNRILKKIVKFLYKDAITYLERKKNIIERCFDLKSLLTI